MIYSVFFHLRTLNAEIDNSIDSRDCMLSVPLLRVIHINDGPVSSFKLYD